MSYVRLSSENEYASLRFAVAPGRKRVPYYSYRAHREPNLLLALEIEACLMTALFSHICTGTGLAPAFSASGPGSPLPHLQCDWARRSRSCNETGLHPGHICTRTGGEGAGDTRHCRLIGSALTAARARRQERQGAPHGRPHVRARERGADPSHALHLRIR